ncbi:MAG: glycosyltransferase family 4 protein [Bacillota bacterium]
MTALVTGAGEPYYLHGVRIIPHAWVGGLFRRIRYLPQVYHAAQEIGADAYWIGNFEVLPVAVYLKRKRGSRLVYDAMEHWPDMVRQSPFLPVGFRWLAAILVDWLDRILFVQADAVLTADTPTMHRYRAHPRTLVNYNFPQLSVLDNYPNELLEKLKNRYAGKRVLVYVGSMGWDRGLREMILALAEVKSTCPNVVLLLIGSFQVPSWQARVRTMVKNAGLDRNVELLGAVPQNELGAYLRIGEVGLAYLWDTPKHHKNISTKQFDYMCCELPVVATDLAPMKQYVGQASAGLLVSPKKQEDLASAIIQLLTDCELAHHLGHNGRNAVEKEWNWEAQEVLLVRTLSSVLDN